MKSSLEGKAILVTGAARGIGAAVARSCSEIGARVILHASAPSDEASQMIAELGISDSDFLFQDLAQPKAGFELFERALAQAGTIDGVVNNAGVFTPSPLEGDVDEWLAGWSLGFAVNVQACADICRSAIGHFRKRAKEDDGAIAGSIVNISSRAAQLGDLADTSAYAAAKAAMIAMTKSMARGLAAENILLYSVAPGWVDTRLMPTDPVIRQQVIDETPLGRPADPRELGDLIAFLLSGACPSATCGTIDVNGGSYVR